ncbi:hypothetical protein HMPREF9104_02197 [Lentilactobacillus kisonensis F0435]|uniref:Uncharacterized protein n=1 Tax=Lentilactobacillus kisonensis F0435 TaxID=797516 RepID=H1LHV6_9LACO|nr:hypothetical protein HMPREF9104_02197 [Lentilactobacillus kisonensis F0435]
MMIALPGSGIFVGGAYVEASALWSGPKVSERIQVLIWKLLPGGAVLLHEAPETSSR